MKHRTLVGHHGRAPVAANVDGNMNKIICTLLLLAPSLASSNDLYVGSYSSVTEADCNLTISLKPQGRGVATQICSAEDGSQRSREESFAITWSVTDQGILLSHRNKTMLFKYSSALSCGDFGKSGSDVGIFATGTDKSSIFSGYGGKFWKSPVTCK